MVTGAGLSQEKTVPKSVTELTNALSPGQYEDLSTDLPTGDDLRFGEVDLEVPPVDQETTAPPDVPLFSSGTVVTQLQNGESSLTPGSLQISPRELTRKRSQTNQKRS